MMITACRQLLKSRNECTDKRMNWKDNELAGNNLSSRWRVRQRDVKNFGTMGRIFLEHMGGVRIFACANCEAPLTNRTQLISTRFTGATGRAFLFNKVVNLKFSEVQDRVMLTGRHMVRDVFCKSCDAKLGWIYEFAVEESQRYKEGRVILERVLIKEMEGFHDSTSTNTSRSSASS